MKYTATQEHSWAAPGHQGGVAFTKSPIGCFFHDYYGENLFRTDTGIERIELGSLLDHTGPIGEAEVFAARVFGAHRSYSMVNGTSGANRAVMAASICEGEFALCDRNCHKSIEQGLMLTGGIPAYFMPTRNRYGIIGPIPPREFSAHEIERKLGEHPLRHLAIKPEPVYAVVTNCTYDGLCYHAAQLEEALEQSVSRIHFDEAWYSYARFNPMYRDRFAMRGDPADHPVGALRFLPPKARTSSLPLSPRLPTCTSVMGAIPSSIPVSTKPTCSRLRPRRCTPSLPQTKWAPP